METLPDLNQIEDDEGLKQCCAAIYESQWAQLLLGESYHPGGLDLTGRLGSMLQLGPADRVLDVASGQGRSALFLAQELGCSVVGVDYGREATQRANKAAQAASLDHLVQFQSGDAEQLPFADETFDVVLCECAFCTFPNKETAARELSRVLKADGRLGLSDLTRNGKLPPELESVMAWIACIADAQPLAQYCAYLERNGLNIRQTEEHPEALEEMVRSVRSTLLATELMVSIGKLTFPNANFDEAKRVARLAHETVRQGKLSYVLILAQKEAPDLSKQEVV